MGCVSVGQPEPSDTAPPTATQVDPSIADGTASAAEQAAAARLISEARAHYAARRYEQAARMATEVVTTYPEVEGSSSALWILARASLETGDFETAEVSAGRYGELLPEDDPRGGEAALVRARALSGLGRDREAIQTLLATPTERALQVRTPGLRFVRERVRNVATEDLAELADAADPENPFVARVRLEHALGLYYRGDTDQAADVARSVIDAQPEPQEVELAQSILAGGVERRAGAPPLLGAILPQSGSPLLQEYARRIEEGIRVALAEHESADRPIELRVADDGGQPDRGVSSVQFLEQQGVLAVVGPLQDAEVTEVAQARQGTLAMISPTAVQHPAEPSVYSLAAADVSGAEQLARYAGQEGFRRIAVVYPSGSASETEARAFTTELRRSSTAEAREFTYVPGSTTFREPLEGARAYEADAIFLPIPEADVELLAPQIAFFGVDSLGISVLGTSGWAQPSVLQVVDSRHLDGAVVAAPQDPGAAGAVFEDFRAAYERINRRTLRSQIPAFGYDAARLLIHAIRLSGGRTSADVSRALEGIREFPGATGTAVRGGRADRACALPLPDRGEHPRPAPDGVGPVMPPPARP